MLSCQPRDSHWKKNDKTLMGGVNSKLTFQFNVCINHCAGDGLVNNCQTLRWRHNDHDRVSNHQPHGCLLNRLFRRRSKKTSKLRVTGLCVGNSPGPVNSPHKGPVTRKMFSFDDVIMFICKTLFRCWPGYKDHWWWKCVAAGTALSQVRISYGMIYEPVCILYTAICWKWNNLPTTPGPNACDSE